MWSCSLFFAAALFQLGDRYHFSFSHSCYKIFMLFFKRNWSPQFFLSLALAFSMLSTPMQTLKLSRKKESVSLLLFFISKSLGGYAIYCRNARVLEMQNFTPASRKGWTYVRTIFSEPTFLGCIIYQIFLPMVFRCARESSAINNNQTRQKANFCFCTRPILYRKRTRSLLKQTANCPLILIHGPH